VEVRTSIQVQLNEHANNMGASTEPIQVREEPTYAYIPSSIHIACISQSVATSFEYKFKSTRVSHHLSARAQICGHPDHLGDLEREKRSGFQQQGANAPGYLSEDQRRGRKLDLGWRKASCGNHRLAAFFSGFPTM
jgi:hypothetical protein